MLPNPVLTAEETLLSDEAREFCERHALFGHLAKAMELARQHFTIIGEPIIQWEHDPDNDDEYLVLEIQAQGSASEVVEAHGRFAREWSQFAALPEVRFIRLLPHSC